MATAVDYGVQTRTGFAGSVVESQVQVCVPIWQAAAPVVHGEPDAVPAAQNVPGQDRLRATPAGTGTKL